MHRRTFLHISVAASVSLRSATAARSNPLSGKIKKAVKFHMVKEDLSVIDKLRLLSDVGFDGVEIRTADRLGQRELLHAIETTAFPVHGIVNSHDPDIASVRPSKGFRPVFAALS